MSAGKLLIHPTPETASPPSVPAMTKALRELRFIGAKLPDNGPNHFLAGESFLQLISFLGCSPHVNLEPPEDGRDNFAYVALLGPWETPRLIHGSNTRPPSCPVCKSRNREWRDLIRDWEDDLRPDDWSCDECGASNPPGDWNWRQQAGAGRFFILVNEIFPSEAVPSDELINRLREQSGKQWRYFYIQD